MHKWVRRNKRDLGFFYAPGLLDVRQCEKCGIIHGYNGEHTYYKPGYKPGVAPSFLFVSARVPPCVPQDPTKSESPRQAQ
jgi:hypothetical protein